MSRSFVVAGLNARGTASGRPYRLTLPALDPCPGVLQGDGAVEDGGAGTRILRIGEEVPEPLELVSGTWLSRGQRWFQLAVLQGLQRVGPEVLGEILALGHVFGVLHREELVVEPHLGVERMVRRHPVDGGLHLAPVGRVAAAGGGIVGGPHLDDLTGRRIFDHAGAGDEVGVAQPHLHPWAQAVVLGRRHFAEVVLLDVDDTRERHLAGARCSILGVVYGIQLLDLTLGVVLDDHFQRPQHGHDPRRGAVQVLAHEVLQILELHHVLALGDPDGLDERPDGFGRVAAPPHAGQSRHARVVPTADMPVLDEAQQLALAHDGVGDVEARELALAGMDARQLEGLKDPFVQGAVHLELQRAQAVGDALDVVGQAVCEVVHGVDAPLVARVVVRGVADAVQHRVAQPHVGRGHVDLGAQHAGAVGELAGPHAPEQVEVLLHGAVAVVALLSGPVGRAAHGVDLLGGVVVDVGLAPADQLQRVFVQRLEVVGSVEGLNRLTLALGHSDRGHEEVLAAVRRRASPAPRRLA